MAEIQWMNGLYVGRGINRATGQMFQSAITFDPLQTALDDQGQQPTLTLKTISSTRQLAKSLDVDASASLRVGRRGNVSAKAQFSQEVDINSYYLYSLVTVDVVNAAQTIRNPVLKSEANALLTSGGWTAFARSYGLEYVEGIIPGGSYYALIEIRTTDSKKKEEITTKISGSYSGFGINAGATTAAANQIKEALAGQDIQVYVCESGGSGRSLPTTLDQMIQEAINFPDVVKQNPVPIAAIVNTYQGSVVIPPNVSGSSFFLDAQASTLNDYGELYLKLKKYRSDLKFTLEHMDEFFSNDSQSDLATKRAAFNQSLQNTDQEMKDLVQAGIDCSEDTNKCTARAPLPDNFFLPLPAGDSMITQQFLSGNSRKDFSAAHIFTNSTGVRKDCNYIQFDKKFKTPPTVRVSLKRIDSDQNKATRVDVYPDAITTDGFDVMYMTWGDSVVYGLEATWFAYGS